jgi:4-alpha-glucanotransferase
MPRAASVSFLYQLAHRHGVQTSYVDAVGRERVASPETLLRVLQVLGAPVAKLGDARAALRERMHEEAVRPVEPVHVAWDGGPVGIPLRLPARQARGALHCRLQQEDGTEQSWVCRIDDLQPAGRARVGGGTFVVKQLELPEKLPPGYHALVLEVPGACFETLVLSAPLRAYEAARADRSWGVFLPLYALHSQHSWGCGDFTDLERLREWAGSLGAGLVGTLPLLAAFLDEPLEPSPYSPVSRLFWNEIYVDVSRAPELDRCHEAQVLMRSPEFVEELLLLRDAPQVHYRRAMALKRRVLGALARTFFAGSHPTQAAFERFLGEHPRLQDYAAFRAVLDRRRVPWTEWPAPLRDGVITAADYDEDARQYHLYVQWLAAEQLRTLAGQARARGPGMYLDLPLGVHPQGYDVWRERPSFAHGVCGGAPPDVVFPRGQNWGFAPLHPEGIRVRGYRYVRAYVRQQMQLAGVLRVDHMPSFHRLFWIPEGMEAQDGVYVSYPSEELYAIFNVESHRHRTLLVGEDLGTVPPEVPEAMARHGFGRMYVVQYELQDERERALPAPPPGALASINNHDMPPLAAYLEGKDVGHRQELGLVGEEATRQAWQQRRTQRAALEGFLRDQGLLGVSNAPGDVLQACLRYLAESPARFVLVNLEDLWLETRPQNVPSTQAECPNWRRKASYPLEEIERLPEVREILEEVNRIIRGEAIWQTRARAAQELAEPV